MQYVTFALDFDPDSAGNSKAARIARMAITTRSSIKLNARALWRCCLVTPMDAGILTIAMPRKREVF
jgi:hypothetical protein